MRAYFTSAFTWLAASVAALWAADEAHARTQDGAPEPRAENQSERELPQLNEQASAALQAPLETSDPEQGLAASADLTDQDFPQLAQAIPEQPVELTASGETAPQPLAEHTGGGVGEVGAGSSAGPTASSTASSASAGGNSTAVSTAAGAAGGGSPLALAVLLPLAALGGGGGGASGPSVLPQASAGTTSQTSQLAGRAIDGYVKGATVFYDANGNGVRDAGEANAVTGEDGSYSLDAVLTAGGRIIMLAGGVDMLTGQQVGMMVAPAGYTGINPFTMLLASSPGLSEGALKAALGIDADISLDDWDPIAGMRSGDAAVAAAAQAAFIKAQQVFAVVQSAAALASHGAGQSTQLLEVGAIAGAVANAIANAGPGNDWQQTLATAVDAALGAALPVAPDAQQQGLADTLKSALTQLLDAMDSGMAGLAAALQGDDHAALAASMAAVAVSQDLLLDAAQGGNVGVLTSLADTDSLARFAGIYETALLAASEGEAAAVQMSVLSLAQALQTPPGAPWILADTAANLAAKVIEPDGPALLNGATGVVVLDTATVEEASLLAGFATLSFVSPKLDASGTQSLSWDDYQALNQAGLHPQGDAEIRLALPAAMLAQAVAQAGPLHAWGVLHLDIDIDSASISAADASVLLAAGLNFSGSDHVTLQLGEGVLGASLDDLYSLGVDQISGPAPGAELHVSSGLATSDALPAIDGALQVTMHLGVGQLDGAVDSASQLAAAGIDLLDNGGQALLTDIDAHHLATAGLAFVLADHVSVQGAGTHLQSSLSDLQQLAVDEVDAGVGTLHLDAGSAAFGARLPLMNPAANVVLHLQAAQLGSAIDHAHELHVAGIDQLDVGGSSAVDLSDVQAAALAADGLAFAAGDMVVVHAGGTHLNTSLHDLQHLGVDEVTSDQGTLRVQHGGALDPLADLPVFDPMLDVTLAVTPAELSHLLAHPLMVANSRIDHLRLLGVPGQAATPPDASVSALDDALAASGADLVLDGEGPLALTDEQAACLLLAGRLQANQNVELTIVHAQDAANPAPDRLDLNLAELAQLGADHVAHVQGAALIVEAGVAGVNLEAELQQLLAQFPPGTALFGADAQVSLDLGQANVDAVSDGLAAELKLLGMDQLLGEDGQGHVASRPLG